MVHRARLASPIVQAAPRTDENSDRRPTPANVRGSYLLLRRDARHRLPGQLRSWRGEQGKILVTTWGALSMGRRGSRDDNYTPWCRGSVGARRGNKCQTAYSDARIRPKNSNRRRGHANRIGLPRTKERPLSCPLVRGGSEPHPSLEPRPRSTISPQTVAA